MLDRLIAGYCTVLTYLLAIALALMVVLVFGNVVLRYAFNSGLTMSEEVSRWLFVWLTFMGAVVALREHGHLGTDALVSRLPARFGRWHPLHQAQYLEASLLLPGYILASQGDRMSMANAVEGRFPFLDHRLVEFAARIPTGMKLRGLDEKHILKRAGVEEEAEP